MVADQPFLCYDLDMTSELKDVLPAAEHTIIEPHPEVLKSGVGFKSDEQQIEEANKAIRTAVGSINDGTTTAPVVSTNNRPKQQTETDKFPVTDSRRWLERLRSFLKEKQVFKGGKIKNAA